MICNSDQFAGSFWARQIDSFCEEEKKRFSIAALIDSALPSFLTYYTDQ